MTSDYVLFTDADCEIPAHWENELDIKILPMPFYVNDIEYHFDLNNDIKEFYQNMRDGAAPTTAQPNPEDFKQLFLPFLEQGKDALYIGVSSGLSGTVNNARIAANELKEDFPERNISIVDSLAISMPMGILVKEAAIMRKNGKSLEETREWLESNKQRANAFFTVNDLAYLKRGGRVTGTAAFFGSLLEIKPILHINSEGKLVPIAKIKGRKSALKRIAQLSLDYAEHIENQVIYILEADCIDEAEELARSIKESAKPADVEIVRVGPVIGSHAGPGTMGVVFFAENREIEIKI